MNTRTIELLRHLSEQQKKKLLNVCVEIEAQLRHCKTPYGIQRLQALYRQKKEIIMGGGE